MTDRMSGESEGLEPTGDLKGYRPVTPAITSALEYPLDSNLIEPVVQRRLPDAIAAQLQQLIEDGAIAPGDRLPPERELAVAYKVSRASMREALNQLVLRGLIDRRPGLGTVVLHREPSGHGAAVRGLSRLGAKLSDAWDFRNVIEPAIAAQAATRRTRADLIQLEEIIRFMDQDESFRTFPSIDRRFHELIARSCHNPVLTALIDLSFDWMDATRDKSFQTRQRWRVSRKGHREIYDAICEGDAEAAGRTMARHLYDVARLHREKTK